MRRYSNRNLRGRRLYENKSWYPNDYDTYKDEYIFKVRTDALIEHIFDFIEKQNYTNRNPSTWGFSDFYNMFTATFLDSNGKANHNYNVFLRLLNKNQPFFGRRFEEVVMLDRTNNKEIILVNYNEMFTEYDNSNRDRNVIRKYNMILLQNLWSYLQKTYKKELTFKVTKLKPNIKKIVNELDDVISGRYFPTYISSNPIEWTVDDFCDIFKDHFMTPDDSIVPPIANAFGFPKIATKMPIYDFIMRNGGVYLNNNINYNKYNTGSYSSWKAGLYDLWDFLLKKHHKQLDFKI